MAFSVGALRVLEATNASGGSDEVPPLPRALQLWDAVATIVSEPTVFELKRHRSGGPNPPTPNDEV